MASTVITSIFVICLATLITASGNLKAGEFTKDSKVLYNGKFDAMGIFFLKRSETIDFKTDGSKIKGIDIQDLKGDSSSWILAGGVDEEFVTIKLESKRGSGYSFLIDIYGYDDEEKQEGNKDGSSDEDDTGNKDETENIDQVPETNSSTDEEKQSGFPDENPNESSEEDKKNENGEGNNEPDAFGNEESQPGDSANVAPEKSSEEKNKEGSSEEKDKDETKEPETFTGEEPQPEDMKEESWKNNSEEKEE